MTDYQPITSADLERGNAAPPQVADGAPAPDASKYAPIEQGDLAPTGIAGQTSEFAYRGIPSAAAARFHASNPLANIFGAAATRMTNGFVNTFEALNAQDQKLLVANGYGNYTGPGALLQHAGDTFNAGATLLKNGFFATGAAISEGFAGAEGQIAREAGAPEDVALSAEREGGFIGTALQSDVGSMHGAAMIDAAKAQAAAPGIWGHAYRVDDTPTGGLTHTPLGRLPSEAESAAQAPVVADALHLPPSTADLIHQTYLDTGRPPAEVLMDAQTNHGGVLDDLVAGKVPAAYQPPTALPVIDTAEIGRLGREASLNELDKHLTDQLEKLHAGDASAADRLNRLQTVEDQLKNEALTGPERKALLDRRDQILIDTNPEALKAAAQPLVDRRNLEAQRARVAEQLGDIERERRAAQTDVALGQGPNLQGGPSRPIDSEGPLMGAAEPTPTAAPEGRAATETPPAKEATSAATTPADETPAGTTQALKATPAPVLRETLPGVSKIGQDIKQEAIERGIADDIEKTAGYTPRVVEEQKAKTLDLVANHFDDARAMLNGKKEIPSDVSPVMLLRALRNYARETKDANLYSEIANSPLVSGTSYAASETRLAAELGPDDPIAKLREIQQAQAKQAGGPKQIAARRAVVKEALPEADKILLPKEEQSWDRFLEAIKC